MWKKIFLNAAAVAATTYGGAVSAGATQKQAAAAVAVTVIANLIGLGQKPPQVEPSDKK